MTVLEPAILSRLRRTGVAIVGGTIVGRELRKWLEEQAVTVVDVGSHSAAVAHARAHPAAPLIVFDTGGLDDVETLVTRLERQRSTEAGRRPVVLVAHARLDEGLAGLGWKGGTHRVAFLRTQSLVHDAALALADLLSSEPEPRPGDPGLLSAVIKDVKEARFDVDALDRELRERLSWVGAVSERVLSSWVFRFQAPESSDTQATLTVAWLDEDGTRFALTMRGTLLAARAAFRASARRGLRGALERLREDRLVGDDRFDDAFVVHSDDAGLAEAARARELLGRLVGRMHTVEWSEETFGAEGDDVDRADVARIVDALAQLWHGLMRARLGFVVGEREDSQS